ncbi:MAG: glycoside hydrolase family 25 protein [Lachnospiraceae bacterium]|nr:glycoside hydrolase family 25 protein [Lachnospiraceae bacterium]
MLGGIRGKLEDGVTVVETLRPYYPDDIVLVSNGLFHFVPISDALQHHDYIEENLNVLENGEFQYVEQGEVISHKGIDVSTFQGEIDWDRVAEDGVEFVFIRAIFRGYGSGKLVEDDTFEQNIEGALRAGIKVGVYVFSQAINEEELREETDLLLEKLAPYKIQCPVVFDVETIANADGRMNRLSVEERTNLTIQFCKIMENAGYHPMIYHNMEMAALMLDLQQLEEYDKWFAYYNDNFYYPYKYKVWQYSEKGKVNGISTDVDMNISFEPLWEE